MSQLFFFSCSDSTHGETTSAEDCTQDVTAEHHTSEDGKLWLLGKQGWLCPVQSMNFAVQRTLRRRKEFLISPFLGGHSHIRD